MNQSRKVNLWLICLAVIGLFLFVLFSWNDPTFRVSHDLTKEQAIARSQTLWKLHGVDVTGWSAQAIQDSVDKVDGYLNHMDLQSQYEQKAPKQAKLNYWKVSFQAPKGTRSVVMQLDPTNGNLISYEQKGLTLPIVVNESRANYLAQREMLSVGLYPKNLQVTAHDVQTVQSPDLLEHGTKKPLQYQQRVFEFDNPAWKFGGMMIHYEVKIVGNQVASLTPVYVLPKDFTSWHDRQQLIGTILTGLSALFSFVLFVLGFVFLFLVKEKKRYGAALWLSVAIFLTFLISNLNQIPLMQMGMLSGGLGAIGQMVTSVFLVVLLVGISFVIAGGTFPMILTGGMLAKQLNPRLWSSLADNDWKARIRQAMWRGYLLAIIWLGFQNLFYWVAQTYFGVFFEADNSMSPANMWVPGLFPLMGWLAGIQEEMVYRLFGINFFKRYWKNTFVATLIPAVIWALGHSVYPVFPTYTRLIELTVFGVVVGYCYLWFGIETTIFAHVVFDVTQMCIPLLLSRIGTQETAGFIFLLSPIVVGYALSLLQPKQKKMIQQADIV